MRVSKWLSILLCFTLLVAFAGCEASDGEDSGESATGKIELPVWPDVEVASAPELSVSSADSEPDSAVSAVSAVSAATSEKPTTSNYTDFTENSANAPDISNITVRTSQSYYSTTDRTITVEIYNRTGWEIGYKQSYVIEKWEGENWSIQSMVDSPDFGNTAYLLGTGRDSYVNLDLGQLEKPLSVGKYRVGLTDMICNGYSGFFTLYAEFSVK